MPQETFLFRSPPAASLGVERSMPNRMGRRIMSLEKIFVVSDGFDAWSANVALPFPEVRNNNGDSRSGALPGI